MKTVGELLQAARQKKHLSIDAVSSLTKIQAKFITALEADDYNHLPESTFVKGFIRNYAQVLGKNPQLLLAIFRRDYSQDARGKVIPRGLTHPLNQPQFSWTPKTTTIAAASFLLTLFTAYLIFQFRLLSNLPHLTVKSPQENALVSALVTVEGSTNPQATITINSQPVPVADTGEFSHTIDLTPGKHTITIQSQSRTGKTTTLQRTVIVE